MEQVSTCHAHTHDTTSIITHLLTSDLLPNPSRVSFLPQRSTDHLRSRQCALTTIFLKVPASFWGNFWFPLDMMAAALRSRAFPVPRSASAELLLPRQPLDAASPPAQASAIYTSTWGCRFYHVIFKLEHMKSRGCVWQWRQEAEEKRRSEEKTAWSKSLAR